MKVLAPALLVFLALTSKAFAGERVQVSGSRISPQSSGQVSGPPIRGGIGVHCKVRDCAKPDSSEPTFPSAELSNTQVLVLVMEQWRETVQTLSQMEAWAELDVTVTLKDGTKVDVHLKVGFGKTDVVSTKKK